MLRVMKDMCRCKIHVHIKMHMYMSVDVRICLTKILIVP